MAARARPSPSPAGRSCSARLIFSGSLYVLATTGLKWLGAITPIGGVLMLAGWAALLVAAGQAPVTTPSK